MPRVAPEQLELEAAHPDVSKHRKRRQGNKPRARRATRPAPQALLGTEGALLTRSDLRALGLERRAIDAVFRALPVVALPGYSRPMVRAEQYLELVEQHTYRDDRVRPIGALG
jgi:hypothetical protein